MYSQAIDTSNQVMENIATWFRVMSIYGDRTNPAGNIDDTIQKLYVKLTLQSGSPPLDMNYTIIEITDGNKKIDLKFNKTGAADDTRYNATALRDPKGAWKIYAIAQGSLIRVCIDTNKTGVKLLPQTDVRINIIPKHGYVAEIKFTTPSGYTTRLVEIL